jgi:cellulose synthase/poly-beta-1,6-N-acetylglucosamine synthase-like glycosyltransferase
MIEAALRVGTAAFVGYVLLHAASSLLLAIASTWTRHRDRRWWIDHRGLLADPDSPGVSVVVPARNEVDCVVQTVRSLRCAAYRTVEVVVVDDGSTDGTFAALDEAFALVPVERSPPSLGAVPVRGAILSVHRHVTGGLVVVRKESAGSKADALNAGINHATHPIVCVVDADAVLDHDALARLVAPFAQAVDPVVATGGSLRVANGVPIRNGQATSDRGSVPWLVRIQEVEYLRAFALSRPAWSAAACLPLISGAFGAFDRAALVAVGGFAADAIGEDLDLVARLQRWRPAGGGVPRLVHVDEAVCWTHVPEDGRTLAAQRRRWGRGLTEVLLSNRDAIGDPAAGRYGVVALPYLLLLELLGPLVEVLGLLLTVVALLVGAVSPGPVVSLVVSATAVGVALSLAAVLSEAARTAAGGPRRILGLVVAALVEPLGYRQRHAVWRLAGTWQALARRPVRWDAKVEVCPPA